MHTQKNCSRELATRLQKCTCVHIEDKRLLRLEYSGRFCRSGVGVTKPIFSVPLFSHFFGMMKTVVTWMISSSYLAGVTAAELRKHLANMNMIESI